MKKIKLIFAIVCVIAFAIVTTVSVYASVLGETKITFEQAIEIATEKVGGDSVKEIEWELKKGNPIYEVELCHDGKKHEVRINAITGEIMKQKSRPSDSSQVMNGLSSSEVTTARTIELSEAAIKHVGGGTVAEVSWKRKNEVLIIEVEVNHNRKNHEIKFNAITGEMIKTK